MYNLLVGGAAGQVLHPHQGGGVRADRHLPAGQVVVDADRDAHDRDPERRVPLALVVQQVGGLVGVAAGDGDAVRVAAQPRRWQADQPEIPR